MRRLLHFFVSMALNAVSWQWLFSEQHRHHLPMKALQVFVTQPGNYSVTNRYEYRRNWYYYSWQIFIQVNSNPQTPVFSQSGDTLTCSPALSYQWYLNGIPISGATNQQFVATIVRKLLCRNNRWWMHIHFCYTLCCFYWYRWNTEQSSVLYFPESCAWSG